MKVEIERTSVKKKNMQIITYKNKYLLKYLKDPEAIEIYPKVQNLKKKLCYRSVKTLIESG